MKRRKYVGERKICVNLNSLVAFSASEKAAVVEHIFGERIERPEVSFARVARLSRYFDEAIIEAKFFR